MSAHHLVTVTAPTKWLSTNQRDHFHQRAVATKLWRETAAWCARSQHLPKFTGPVTVTATVHRVDRRIYDLDGIAPSLKACIDGIRDAGCLGGDDWRFIPELTLRHGDTWADAALVLSISQLEDAS